MIPEAAVEACCAGWEWGLCDGRRHDAERATRKLHPCGDCPGTLKSWCCTNESGDL